MNSATIADRIREIMQKLGLTQKDLAETLGISQPAISLYLQGRTPPADILYRLSRISNRPMEWILTGEPETRDPQTVREMSPIYGNQHLLLKLWEQLPDNIQRDILVLLRHIVESEELGH